MTPPLKEEQIKLLKKIYYDDKYLFGRDKLYKFIQANHQDSKISRRQVLDWLKQQEIYQLNLRMIEPKSIKTTVSKAPHQSLGIDLIDMQNYERNGYKYILNCIDLFSRMVYAIALKDKTDKSVLDGLKKLMRDKIKTTKMIKSDNGSEFISNIMKEYLKSKNIKQVLGEAGHPQTNGMIERANGVLKGMIKKSLDINPKFNWDKQLNNLTRNINKTISFGTDKTPQEIEQAYKDLQVKSKEEAGEKVLEDNYEHQKSKKKNRATKQRFFKRQRVRIKIENDKDKNKQWSNKIYQIVAVYKPKTDYGVYQYKVGEFKTLFKEEELQLVTGEVQNKIQDDEVWKISKIIEHKVINNKPYYEVRWVNYKETTDETEEVLLKDVPKLVNKFNKESASKFKRDKNGILKVVDK